MSSKPTSKVVHARGTIDTPLLLQIVDIIPHAVFWKDRACVYLGCNATFARDVGFAPEQIVGKTDYDLPWTAEQTEFFRSCDRQVMESGEPMLNMTPSLNIADGTKHWARSSKVPLRDESGEIVGVLGTYADITDQKRLEQALELSNEEIKRLNSVLQRSNDDLRHFANAVCHDLRSPLLSIEAGLEQMGRMVATGPADDMPPHLELIQGCVRRLDDMIRSLLRHSSVERSDLVLDEVPLNEVVTQVRHDLSVEIDKTGTTMTASDLPVIRADRSLVYQLLLNLVENAIKYRREKESPCVEITGRSSETHHELRVSDNGIGFEPAQADQIFAPFERLLRHGVAAGSGIGLTTVRRIAEIHGATVRAEGMPGEGATFIVDWPRRAGASSRSGS